MKKIINKRNVCIVISLIVSFYIFWNYLRPVSKNPFIDKDSIQYVNSMYQSKGEFYEQLLSDNEKKLYMLMLRDISKNKGSRSIGVDEYGCADYGDCYAKINMAYYGLIIDHPELISLGTYALHKDSSTEFSIKYRNAIFLRPTAIIYEMRILRIIDDIKKETKDMSEIDKIKYVYDFVGNNTYDKVFTYGAKNQSAANVFIKHNAVCSGFAKASQIIFQNIGIESYMVLGGFGNGMHAWNIVRYGDEYYYFDATVGASVKKNSASFYKGLGADTSEYSISYTELYPNVVNGSLLK